MKKFITAVLAASVVAAPIMATPAMAAPYQHRDTHVVIKKVTVRDNHRNVQNHRWNRGERFDYRQARNYRVVNARQYHLREAPRGYRWVQSGNDAVLIGITSGIVASVLANAIR